MSAKRQHHKKNHNTAEFGQNLCTGKEVRAVILLGILFLFIFFGLLGIAVRLAWGFLKFITGVGLFCACPLLFLLLLMTGTLNFGVVLIILLALCGIGFHRG